MITDKLITPVCLVALFLFFVVCVIFVKEFDLFVVLTIAFAMATFDFWRTLFRARNGNKGGSSN